MHWNRLALDKDLLGGGEGFFEHCIGLSGCITLWEVNEQLRGW